MPLAFCTYRDDGKITTSLGQGAKSASEIFRQAEVLEQFQRCLETGGQEKMIHQDDEGRWWAVRMIKIPMDTVVIGDFAEVSAGPTELTDQEVRVLSLLCQDFSNREISQELKTSPQNLSNILKRLRGKLNCNTNYGLVKYAMLATLS